MDENLANTLSLFANVAALAVIIGGISVWAVIISRVRQRRPLVPFEPRRPVPWNMFDVLAILLAYVSLGGTLFFAAHTVLGWEFQDGIPSVQQADIFKAEPPADDVAGEEEAEESENGIDLERAHPVVVLLSGDTSPGTFLLCLFAVVVMAPVAEEFFFRLLLQGTLEKLDFRFQRVWRYSGRFLGLLPILLSSLLFAGLHARDPESPLPVEQLVQLFTIDTVTKVLLVAGAVVYLKTFRNATWTDLGLRFDTLGKDVQLAVSAFLAVVVPIYVLQEGLGRLLPNTVPDPVPLFFFALALGYLYFRTHRLVPAILLHLIFNGTAICMFFAVTS